MKKKQNWSWLARGSATSRCIHPPIHPSDEDAHANEQNAVASIGRIGRSVPVRRPMELSSSCSISWAVNGLKLRRTL